MDEPRRCSRRIVVAPLVGAMSKAPIFPITLQINGSVRLLRLMVEVVRYPHPLCLSWQRVFNLMPVLHLNHHHYFGHTYKLMRCKNRLI